MSKKSFLEKELARESKLRKRCAEIKHGVIPGQSEKRRKEIEEQLKGPYGIIFTPNEIREQYGYPTMSDEPNTVTILNKIVGGASSERTNLSYLRRTI